MLVAIELTVPWEDNCEEAHERKKLKSRYANILADCKVKGWRVWLDIRKNMQDNKKTEKQQNSHPGGYGNAQTICAGSRDPRQLVDWPPLLTRQLEDVIDNGRNIQFETI